MLRHRTAQRESAGFGLLEAIVALTLLAGTGLALFGWIQQNLQTATRLRLHEQQARLTSSAQALVDTVNPMEKPRGSMEVSGLRVEWQAELVEPVRDNASFSPEQPGHWRVGLYRLDIRAVDSNEGVDVRFEQWCVGTQRKLPVARSLDR